MGNRRDETPVLFELFAVSRIHIAVLPGESRGIFPGLPSEHDGLQERVAPQPVGAVHF